MNASLSYLTHVRQDVETVSTLLDDDALGQPVPGCPGWNLRRLVEHLGQVHRMVRSAMVDGRPVARDERESAPRDTTALRDWLHSGFDEMLAALAEPSAPTPWCFDPEAPDPVAFWHRRQAMEHAIHRVDAQQAMGLPAAVDAALAADGVAEVLDVMVRLRTAEGALRLPPSRLVLSATDTGDVWTLGNTGPATHASATAEDLFLALWHRRPVEDLGLDAEATRLLQLPLVP